MLRERVGWREREKGRWIGVERGGERVEERER